MNLTSSEAIEAACRGMYGKTWDGPLDKMPGSEMKEVWRTLARKALTSVAALMDDKGAKT